MPGRPPIAVAQDTGPSAEEEEAAFPAHVKEITATAWRLTAGFDIGALAGGVAHLNRPRGWGGTFSF